MTTGFGFCPICGTPRTAAEQKLCPVCGSAFAAAPAVLPGALVAGPVPAIAPASAAPFAPAATGVVPSGVNGPAVGVVAAGALIGLAAFLPWETILGVGYNGFQVGTAGSIAIVLGILIGLLGLTQMNGRGMGSGSRLLALLGGLAALGLAILAVVQLNNLNNQTKAIGAQSFGAVDLASLGVGPIVVAIGGALAIGAALVARRRNSVYEALGRSAEAEADRRAAIWAHTHTVPAGGLAVWDEPDADRAPVTQLLAGAQVRKVEDLGAWAKVDAKNGWIGWVDGRLLSPRT